MIGSLTLWISMAAAQSAGLTVGDPQALRAAPPISSEIGSGDFVLNAASTFATSRPTILISSDTGDAFLPARPVPVSSDTGLAPELAPRARPAYAQRCTRWTVTR